MIGRSKLKGLIHAIFFFLQTVLLASESLTGFAGILIFKKGWNVLTCWVYI